MKLHHPKIKIAVNKMPVQGVNAVLQKRLSANQNIKGIQKIFHSKIDKVTTEEM